MLLPLSYRGIWIEITTSRKSLQRCQLCKLFYIPYYILYTSIYIHIYIITYIYYYIYCTAYLILGVDKSRAILRNALQSRVRMVGAMSVCVSEARSATCDIRLQYKWDTARSALYQGNYSTGRDPPGTSFAKLSRIASGNFNYAQNFPDFLRHFNRGIVSIT